MSRIEATIRGSLFSADYTLTTKYDNEQHYAGKRTLLDVATKADELQLFEFMPVTTTSVRLEVVPVNKKTVGLMEWMVK